MRRSNTQDLSGARDRLVADFKGFIDDAEGFLDAMASYSGDTAARARAAFESKIERLRALVGEGQDSARQKYRETIETTDRYVHTRPWQAIGIGVAIGMLIGYMSRPHR